MKLIDNTIGEEIPCWTRVPDQEGRSCLVEHLVDRWDGKFVLISHADACAHLVPPASLGARIEE
ncbi:hypothetical protein ACQPYK_11330 [Streptosporangium sp. CA-135522]|uniref:hypothetical protein n=1 Tax=Streptosporangium sp. CA-135522 TaxID=3240072 RepID=UPI003D911739